MIMLSTYKIWLHLLKNKILNDEVIYYCIKNIELKLNYK